MLSGSDFDLVVETLRNTCRDGSLARNQLGSEADANEDLATFFINSIFERMAWFE